MTYCVATRLRDGLVFLSDSRTNAGVDQVSTFRKMAIFERPGDRVVVLLSAGNLAITQRVKECLDHGPEGERLWNASRFSEVAEAVGAAIRRVYEHDHKALESFGIDFNCSFLVGGQIAGETPRLFMVYAAGNFIEAQDDGSYFQIGESKYGKPILDRVIEPDLSLRDAAKCLLISMDSTLKSNLSVGLPLDLLIYPANRLAAGQPEVIDDRDAHFQSIRTRWGELLREAFQALPARGD